MDEDTPAEVSRPGTKFGVISAGVIEDPAISNTARLVYAILCCHAAGDRSAYPGRKRLAKMLGCSVDTVDRATKALIDAGVLKIEHRFGDDGEQRSSLYLLHDDLNGGRISAAPPGRTHAATPRRTHAAPGGRMGAAHNNTTGNNTTKEQTELADARSEAPSLFVVEADERPAEPEPTVDPAKELLQWWWERQEPRPAGRGAWHSGLASIRAVLEAGWSPAQVGQALKDVVPPLSVGSLEFSLNSGRRVDPKSAQRRNMIGGWLADADRLDQQAQHPEQKGIHA